MLSLSLLPCVPICHMDLLRRGALCSLLQKCFGGSAAGGIFCGTCVHFKSSLI